MAEQHRATDLQWVCIRARASDNVAYSTILELRDRIEALEAAAKPNHPPEIPDSSLVERVAAAISGDGGPMNWRSEARAAIREVAAWLSEQERHVLDWAAVTLEGEAEHRSMLSREEWSALLAALGDQAG